MYKRPMVLGFLGRSRSGKTTAAQYLESIYNSKTLAFANPIKDLAIKLFDLSYNQVYGSQAEKETADPRYGKTPRKIVQDLGEELRHQIDPDIWAKRGLKDAKEIHQSTGRRLIVFDDVRRANEVDYIVGSPYFQGYVIKLECPETRKYSEDIDHISEQEVDKINPTYIYKTITANLSPNAEELKDKVLGAMASLVDEIFEKRGKNV